jgi:hypothetical protein
MDDWQSGGIRIGNQTIRSMAYADDIVLVAKYPQDLKDMIQRLSRYAERRELTISTDKTKVVKFSAGGRRSPFTWKCGDGELQEVSTFCYLGFEFQANGSFKAHIKKLVSRGKKQVATVWSLGERMFPENFVIRKQMYASLVEPSMAYGCELFGFTENVQLERVQRTYFRWTLGVAPWTKIEGLMQEAALVPVHFRTSKRALEYEMRAQDSPCMALRECIRQTQENRFNIGMERRDFLDHLGYSMGSQYTAAQITQRYLDQLIQKAFLGEVIPFVLPGYLQRGRDYKMVARFRLGNETRVEQTWRKDRSCRVCQKEIETMDHVLECSGVDTREDVLHMSGVGRSTMFKILQWRAANEFKK